MVANNPALAPISSFPSNYLPFLHSNRLNTLQQQQLLQQQHVRHLFHKREEVKGENEHKNKSLTDLFKPGVTQAEMKDFWDFSTKNDTTTVSTPAFSFNASFPLKNMQHFPGFPTTSSSNFLSAMSSPRFNSFMPMMNISPYNSFLNLALSAAAIANYKNRIRKDFEQTAEKNSPTEKRAESDGLCESMHYDNNLHNCLSMKLFKEQYDVATDKNNYESFNTVKSFFKKNNSIVEKYVSVIDIVVYTRYAIFNRVQI